MQDKMLKVDHAVIIDVDVINTVSIFLPFTGGAGIQSCLQTYACTLYSQHDSVFVLFLCFGAFS